MAAVGVSWSCVLEVGVDQDGYGNEDGGVGGAPPLKQPPLQGQQATQAEQAAAPSAKHVPSQLDILPGSTAKIYLTSRWGTAAD